MSMKKTTEGRMGKERKVSRPDRACPAHLLGLPAVPPQALPVAPGESEGGRSAGGMGSHCECEYGQPDLPLVCVNNEKRPQPISPPRRGVLAA